MDSKEDWMLKKERYQRRPGSRRTEDIGGGGDSGNQHTICFTFLAKNFAKSGQQLGSKCNYLFVCR